MTPGRRRKYEQLVLDLRAGAAELLTIEWTKNAARMDRAADAIVRLLEENTVLDEPPAGMGGITLPAEPREPRPPDPGPQPGRWRIFCTYQDSTAEEVREKACPTHAMAMATARDMARQPIIYGTVYVWDSVTGVKYAVRTY